MENVNNQLLDALKALFASYKQLADSGDAGNWRIEDFPEGKQALQAIAAAEQAQQAEPVAADPAVAAIQFALETHSDGLHFLRLWNEGEFDLLRREWPEAPEDIYIGADPLLEAPAQPPVVAVAVPDAIELLREHQWAGSYFNGHGYATNYCLVCQKEEQDGHADDCKLAAVLAAAQKGGA